MKERGCFMCQSGSLIQIDINKGKIKKKKKILSKGGTRRNELLIIGSIQETEIWYNFWEVLLTGSLQASSLETDV